MRQVGTLRQEHAVLGQLHTAKGQRPDTGNRAQQRGLAAAGRPLHQHRLTRLQHQAIGLHLQLATGQQALHMLQLQPVARHHVFTRCRRLQLGRHLPAVGHAPVKGVQTLGGGTPAGQRRVGIDKPAQRILHLAKGGRNLDQVPQLDGTGKIARSRHQEREDDGRLLEEGGEPDQPLLRLDQAQVVAQHRTEAVVQLLMRCRFATVQRNRFAVLAHAHQVVAEIGLAPLLPEIQPDQDAANIVRHHAADRAVGDRDPHHIPRQRPFLPSQAEAEAARQCPQDANERHQRHHRVQQPHGNAERAAGEACNVFLDPLVRVVRYRGTPALPRQFQMVVAIVPQPLVQVVARHPGTPAQVQQLRDVELVHRQDDGDHRQPAEAGHLAPEHLDILVLQGVVEHVVPLVEQHAHVDRAQVQRHDHRQHGTRPPFFLGMEIRPGQSPGILQEDAPAAARAAPGIRQRLFGHLCRAGAVHAPPSSLSITRTVPEGNSRDRSDTPGSSGPTCPRRSRSDCGWPVSRMA